ncbi:uncharacterized protein LOC116259064 isoform X2 [Nymphaea colorata]|uniref:uncharacterized protein LOC116259064 isoform X2 n=1 Tax=Nymphaea colorata TaxID=210225 RepID=UPI00129E6788|nr:uncharacterized protein LOC116259064 isoform X2 [Nymphaea colorata]
MVLEHKKRPFCEDESCQLTSKKHAGQLECNNRLPTFEEIFQCNNLPHELFDSGGRVSQNKGVHDIFSSSFPPTTDTSGVPSNQINAFRGHEVGCDSPVEESGTCGLHDYCSRHVLTRIKEPEFALLDYYPRKPVAIGPDHQAHVPVWEPELLNSPFSSRKMDIVFEEDDQRKMGSCIIQMPDMESDSYHDKNIGSSRVHCTCLDQGSVRCVRQHIAEEKEKLKSLLGQNILMELGFDEMGEDVARRWSMDEVNLFQEVVYSNPVSMGKNFWAELSLAFPARSKKELVSYYFNVFILGKRTLQNRWETCDVDSDNDEWQGGDYNELAESEEDEDSVMESEAVDHDELTSVYHVCENEEEYDDDDDDDDDDGEEEGIEGNEKWEEEEEEEEAVTEDVSGELDAQNCFTNSPDGGCVSGLDIHLDEANQDRCTDAQDTRNASSVPCECCHHGNDFQTAIDTSAMPCPCPEATVKAQGNMAEARTCGNKESGGVFGEGFLCEHPCDSKIWDIGFVSMSGKDVDILPTCSMMKEVFGDEAWNNEVLRDSSRIS